METATTRQAPCGCNRKALAAVLAEEMEVWAMHHGLPRPVAEALAFRFEGVILDMYRDNMTECDRCRTAHGDEMHRCNDATPDCIAAARARATANRHQRLTHTQASPDEI